MPRFFVNKTNINRDIINIDGEEAYHISKVLRLRCEDNIVINDGNNIDYLCEIVSLDKSNVTAKIIEIIKNNSEPLVKIILFQGMPKLDKMDFIIQKSVELGVNEIYPVITERTITKINNQKDENRKNERWQRISKEAAKQSNRGIIPKVYPQINFCDALEIMKTSDLKIIAYEKEKEINLRKITQKIDLNIKEISIIIGAEGGFSPKEIEEAVELGVKSISLGPRILRTETASITLLSILMYEMEML